jgi:hypothetical protein
MAGETADAASPGWRRREGETSVAHRAGDVPSADHARLYVGTENPPLPDTRVVMRTTTGFLDRYLHDDGDAVERIRKAFDGEASFQVEVVVG